MAYSDYTSLQKLTVELGITHKRQNLFHVINPINPSQKLMDDISEAQAYYSLITEKAKSEFLITPILKEVKRTHVDNISVFSGVMLETHRNGLNGFCDFILTAIADSVEMCAPICCVVEAKNRSIEEGFAQCAAEMFAALLFNQQSEIKTDLMFGCVTNGYEWHFLKLIEGCVLIDTQRFFLNDLAAILGIFQLIISQS
ncbi:MAG: hypothetical protein RL637_495 [Pseudomonadota bacterium]|jgi:hypothetical protein